MTSGMHRRPFEGRHLVKLAAIIILHPLLSLGMGGKTGVGLSLYVLFV